MFTLHCTPRVVSDYRLSLCREDEVSVCDTSLGDWYANLIDLGETRWVFCVSERTLVPAIFHFGELDLVDSLIHAVDGGLASVGVGWEARERERNAMLSYSVALAQKGPVLCATQDLAEIAKDLLAGGATAEHLSEYFLKSPVGHTGYATAADLVRDLPFH